MIPFRKPAVWIADWVYIKSILSPSVVRFDLNSIHKRSLNQEKKTVSSYKSYEVYLCTSVEKAIEYEHSVIGSRIRRYRFFIRAWRISLTNSRADRIWWVFRKSHESFTVSWEWSTSSSGLTLITSSDSLITSDRSSAKIYTAHRLIDRLISTEFDLLGLFFRIIIVR